MAALPRERTTKVYEGGFLKKAWLPLAKHTRVFNSKTFYKLVLRDACFWSVVGVKSMKQFQYLRFIKRLRDEASDATMADEEEEEGEEDAAAPRRMQRGRYISFRENFCDLAIPRDGGIYTMTVMTSLRKG